MSAPAPPVARRPPPGLAVVGAGGRIGTILRAAWPGASVTWISARPDAPGCRPWSACDGALALAPLLDGARVVVCLSGATPAAPETLLPLNAAAAGAVARAAADRGLPAIFLSSAAVYGPGRSLDERAPRAPVTAYGLAKVRAEDAVARHPGTTCLRLANVMGHDALGRAIERGGQIVVDRFPGGSGPCRSVIGPALLADALAALATAAAAGAALPRVLNIALRRSADLADLLDGAGLPYRRRPAPPGAARVVTLDVARAMRLLPGLDWDATPSLAAALPAGADA